MAVRDDLFLAFVRACGDEPRSPIERVPECFELARVDRWRRRVDLQVADSRDRARTEFFEAARQRLVLGQHEREAIEQRPQQPARAPPPLEAAERHAAVHERQRHAGVGGLQDQVRPDLRLGEHGEIGRQ